MSNYSRQYITSSKIPQSSNYSSTTYQNNYISSYSSYNSHQVYSNNVKNYNNSTYRITANPTNLSASNNYNINQALNKKILPPKTYYSNRTSIPVNKSYYPNNNRINNNFINYSYQTSKINTTYSNNTNNNNFRTTYIIKTNKINNVSNNNILELTANSNKSMAYRTINNPISYRQSNKVNLTFNNNYLINSINSSYVSQRNQQNSFINKFGSTRQNLNGYNPNLVSKLKGSYFNERILPYSVATYEPIQPSNKNNILDSYINSNFELVNRYSTSSVPVRRNNQKLTEIDNDIIQIEEVELIPNKGKNYMQRTTIQFNNRNNSIIIPQTTSKYYIPKKLSSTNRHIRAATSTFSKIDYSSSTLPLNTASYYNMKEETNPNYSFRTNFPYNNNKNKNNNINNKPGVYSKKIYRVNLNKKIK